MKKVKFINDMVATNLAKEKSRIAREKLNKYVMKNSFLRGRISLDTLTNNVNNYIQGINQGVVFKRGDVDFVDNICMFSADNQVVRFMDIYFCQHYQYIDGSYGLSDKYYLFENKCNITLNETEDAIVSTKNGLRRVCVAFHVTVPVEQARQLFKYHGSTLEKGQAIVGMFKHSLAKDFTKRDLTNLHLDDDAVEHNKTTSNKTTAKEV